MRERIFFLVVLIAVGLPACNTSPQAKEARFLQRGQRFLAEKDYSRALLEFQNAAKAVPSNAEPYYRMGLTYLETERFREAVQAFDKATKLNPKHLGAQLKLASLMSTSRDPRVLEDARTRLQSVEVAKFGGAETLDALAVVEMKLGKTAAGAELLNEALENYPADLQNAILNARVKLGNSDQAGAEGVLRQASEKAPKSAEAATVLGRFYARTRRPVQAETELRRALGLNPKYAPALYTLGLVLIGQNRLGEAEQIFRQLAAAPDQRYEPAYGLFLFQYRSKPAGLAEFQRVAKEHPEDRNARERLLNAYLNLNRTRDAEAVLAAVLKKNPRDSDALLRRAEFLIDTGKPGDAEKDLNSVLTFKPDAAQAHFDLARVKKLQGLTSSERQELSAALQLDPKFLDARLALASDYLETNLPNQALQLLNQTPEFQSNSLPVVVQRIWALLALGKTDEASHLVDSALPAQRAPDLVLQSGIVRMRKTDYAGARKDAEEILQQDPENLKALRLLIDSYARQNQASQALLTVRRFAAGRPKSYGLQIALGEMLIGSRDLVGARKAFEAAEAIEPKNSNAKLQLAEIDRAENRIDSARQRLNTILSLDPVNVSALLLAADIAISAGERAAGIANYRRVVDIQETNVLALDNLAFLIARDNPDQALAYAQRAAELEPDSASAQDTLGWVYYCKQIYQTAIEHLKVAVAKDPTPQRKYHLGMSYLKAGDRRRGLEILQAALSQNGNLPVTEKEW